MSTANALLGSRLRLGELKRETLSEEQRRVVAEVANLDIVSYRGRVGGTFGHSYFRANPAVSSDLIARVRYGLLPGEGMRSGLRRVEEGSNFWVIEDDYLESPVPGGSAR